MSSFRLIPPTERSPTTTSATKIHHPRTAAAVSKRASSPGEPFLEEESLRSESDRSPSFESMMDWKHSNRTSYSLAPSGDGTDDPPLPAARSPYSASNISEDSVGTFGHRRRPLAVYPPVTQANLTLLNSLVTASSPHGMCGAKTRPAGCSGSEVAVHHQSTTNKAAAEHQDDSSVEDVQMLRSSQDSAGSTPLLGSRSTLSSAPTLLTIPPEQALSSVPSTSPPSPQESGLATRRFQKTPAPLDLGNNGSSGQEMEVDEVTKAPFAKGMVSVYPSVSPAAAPKKCSPPSLRRSRRVPLPSYLPEPDYPPPHSAHSMGSKTDPDKRWRADQMLYVEYGPELARARTESTHDLSGPTTATTTANGSQDQHQRHGSINHSRVLSDPISAMSVNEFCSAAASPTTTADHPPQSARPSLRAESITSTAAQGGCWRLHQQPQQPASPRIWSDRTAASSPSVPVEAAPLSKHTSLLVAARASLHKSRAGFQRSRSPDTAATPEAAGDQTRVDSTLDPLLTNSSRDFVAGRIHPPLDGSRSYGNKNSYRQHSQTASIPAMDSQYHLTDPLDGSTRRGSGGDNAHVGKVPARASNNTLNNHQNHHQRSHSPHKGLAAHWIYRLKNSLRRTAQKTVIRKPSRNVTDFVEVLDYHQHS